jgi:hypothetical protein
MKAKDLKKLLETVSDDVEVVIRASDHNYRTCSVDIESAEDYGHGEFGELADPKHPDVKDVLVFW